MESVFFLLIYILETRTLKAEFIQEIFGSMSIYLLLTQGVAVCLVVYALILRIEKVDKKCFYSLFFYVIVLLGCNFMANGISQRCFSMVYPYLSMSSLFLIVSSNKTRFKKFISLLSSFYLCCLIIHFFDSYIKRGMESVPFIMGIENQVILTFMLGLVYCSVNYILNGSLVKLRIYFVLLLLSTLNVFSVSGLFGVFVIFIVVLFPSVTKLIQSLSLFNLFVIYLIGALCFIVFSTLILEHSAISNFLESSFGKSSTLSGRTLIWPLVLIEIMKSPFIGHGFSMDENVFMLISQWSNKPVYLSAHNQILQTLYNSGLLGLLAFCVFVFYCSRYMELCNNSKLDIIIKATFLGICVSILAESPQLNHLIELLIAVCAFVKIDRINYLNKQNKIYI